MVVIRSLFAQAYYNYVHTHIYIADMHTKEVSKCTVTSERSIFSENHDYKSFLRVAVNPYVPIIRGLDARGGRKLRTDTPYQTHGTTTVTFAAHARRGLMKLFGVPIIITLAQRFVSFCFVLFHHRFPSSHSVTFRIIVHFSIIIVSSIGTHALNHRL